MKAKTPSKPWLLLSSRNPSPPGCLATLKTTRSPSKHPYAQAVPHRYTKNLKTSGMSDRRTSRTPPRKRNAWLPAV
eukprot:753421-Hanusia_phi.AAC.1